MCVHGRHVDSTGVFCRQAVFNPLHRERCLFPASTDDEDDMCVCFCAVLLICSLRCVSCVGVHHMVCVVFLSQDEFGHVCVCVHMY